MAFCRHCGKEMLEGDEYCSRCGSALGNPSVEEPQTETLPKAPMDPSPSNASILNKESTIKKPRQRRNKWYALIAGGVVVIVLVTVVIILLSDPTTSAQLRETTLLKGEIASLCVAPPTVDQSDSKLADVITCKLNADANQNVTIMVTPNRADPRVGQSSQTCSFAAVVEASDFTIIPYEILGTIWYAQGSDSYGSIANLASVQSRIGGTVVTPSGTVELLQAVHQYPDGCSGANLVNPTGATGVTGNTGSVPTTVPVTTTSAAATNTNADDACQADGATVNTAMAALNANKPEVIPILASGSSPGDLAPNYLQTLPTNPKHYKFAISSDGTLFVGGPTATAPSTSTAAGYSADRWTATNQSGWVVWSGGATCHTSINGVSMVR